MTTCTQPCCASLRAAEQERDAMREERQQEHKARLAAEVELNVACQERDAMRADRDTMRAALVEARAALTEIRDMRWTTDTGPMRAHVVAREALARLAAVGVGGEG